MNPKKILKITGFFLLSFIAFILIYSISVYILSRISIEKETGGSEVIAIYIKSNGVHTDIVVPIKNPQKDWSKEIKFEHTTSKDTTYNYVGLGWGDKGFYLETPTWADLKVSVAFKAATGLSTTAIHATFFKSLSESETCKKIMISKSQYHRLINYIDSSFQTDSQGHFMKINTNANYGDNDAFYEANGTYSLFHTCNTWANNSLKSCGQKCCFWTPFDTGIFINYN